MMRKYYMIEYILSNNGLNKRDIITLLNINNKKI